MSEAAGRAVIVVHRAVRILLLVVVPLIAVVAGLYVYATGGREVETDNAYVKANIVPISASVNGRVIEVLARDNQPVEAGALLFRLDPEPYQIAVDGARAQMDVVRTNVQSLRAEYRATLQDAAEARSRIDFLEKHRAATPTTRRATTSKPPGAGWTAFAKGPTACSPNCPAIPICRSNAFRVMPRRARLTTRPCSTCRAR